MSNEQRKTPLHDAHLELGAKMMDFAGWRLPMQYSGIREEHLAVRRAVGLFDVSHMGEILVSGPGAFDFLDYLLTRNMSGVQSGRALYSAMCNERGGTVDDLIVYPLSEDRYLLVVNAANTATDLAHIQLVAKTWAAAEKPLPQVEDRSADYAQLALQGPNAEDLLFPIIPEVSRLRPFRFLQPDSAPNWLVSRTGYTGEDGFEIYLPPAQAHDLWQKLLEAGAVPAGLGARDTLRLEAALPLSGHQSLGCRFGAVCLFRQAATRFCRTGGLGDRRPIQKTNRIESPWSDHSSTGVPADPIRQTDWNRDFRRLFTDP